MPAGTSRQAGGVGVKLFLFLPFLIFGLLLSASLIRAFARDLGVYAWPKIECSIIWSGIEESLEDGGEATYRFKVVYRYSANGWSFSGDRYRPGDSGSSQSEAQDLLSQFPAGARVPCYYNPKDPSHSLLERPNPLLLLPMVLIALILLVVGVLGILRQNFSADRNAGYMAIFLIFVLISGLGVVGLSLTQSSEGELALVLLWLGLFFALIGTVGFLIVYRNRLRKS